VNLIVNFLFVKLLLKIRNTAVWNSKLQDIKTLFVDTDWVHLNAFLVRQIFLTERYITLKRRHKDIQN